MDAAGREMQVRTFVEEVWNGKNYAAIFDLHAENYANPFGTGPAARAEPRRSARASLAEYGTCRSAPSRRYRKPCGLLRDSV